MYCFNNTMANLEKYFSRFAMVFCHYIYILKGETILKSPTEEELSYEEKLIKKAICYDCICMRNLQFLNSCAEF